MQTIKNWIYLGDLKNKLHLRFVIGPAETNHEMLKPKYYLLKRTSNLALGYHSYDLSEFYKIWQDME